MSSSAAASPSTLATEITDFSKTIIAEEIQEETKQLIEFNTTNQQKSTMISSSSQTTQKVPENETTSDHGT